MWALQLKFYLIGKHLGSIPCKIFVTIFIMDKERTQTNESNDKKVVDDVQSWDDIERLYASRKDRRWVASIKDEVDALIWRFEDYLKKSKERLITTASNNTDSHKD